MHGHGGGLVHLASLLCFDNLPRIVQFFTRSDNR
jgi:hypothetical protein